MQYRGHGQGTKIPTCLRATKNSSSATIACRRFNCFFFLYEPNTQDIHQSEETTDKKTDFSEIGFPNSLKIFNEVGSKALRSTTNYILCRKKGPVNSSMQRPSKLAQLLTMVNYPGRSPIDSDSAEGININQAFQESPVRKGGDISSVCQSSPTLASTSFQLFSTEFRLSCPFSFSNLVP